MDKSNFKYKILKIFLENCNDINEERKNDTKYQNQADDLYKKTLELIKKYKPDDENIYELSKIGSPFDVVFTIIQNSQVNAIYRRNYKKNISIIIINCLKFPIAFQQEKFDYIFEKLKSVIIHEIIHYLDIEVRDIPIDPTEVNKDPFGHPIEFNAYFQQLASPWYDLMRKMIKSSTPLDDFNLKIGNNAREFSNKFWDIIKKNSKIYDLISNDNRFRWNKRVYDLYFNLKNELFDKISNDDIKNDIKKIEEKLKYIKPNVNLS